MFKHVNRHIDGRTVDKYMEVDAQQKDPILWLVLLMSIMTGTILVDITVVPMIGLHISLSNDMICQIQFP